MKIDRLIGIVVLLLNRRRVTAGEFAEHYEVSERTIYRDIDALCRAGTPSPILSGIKATHGTSLVTAEPEMTTGSLRLAG